MLNVDLPFPASLTALSVIASSLISRFGSARFQAFVGVTSPIFLNPPQWLRILRIGGIFLCGFSSINFILLNPFFLIHLAKSGFDCRFITPLALCLDRDSGLS
jgi:hypothetical protein